MGPQNLPWPGVHTSGDGSARLQEGRPNMDSPHPEARAPRPRQTGLVLGHAAFVAGALLPSSLGIFHEDIDLIMKTLL